MATFLLEGSSSLSLLIRWFKYTSIELQGAGGGGETGTFNKTIKTKTFRISIVLSSHKSFSFQFVYIFCKLERSHITGIVDLLHFAAGLY